MGDFQPTESVILTAAAPDTGKSRKMLIFLARIVWILQNLPIMFCIANQIESFWSSLPVIFYTPFVCVNNNIVLYSETPKASETLPSVQKIGP